MKSTLSSEGLYLEHSVEDQRGMLNTFIGLYAIIAAVALIWTALAQRDLFIIALGASAALAVWAWRMRRRVAPGALPWTFSVTADELRHHDTQREIVLTRSQVDRVRVSRRHLGRAGVVTVVEACSAAGANLLRLTVPVDYQESVEAALEGFEWMPARD